MEDYTNVGHGLVFTDESTVERLEKLFEITPFWRNTDLNNILGWQFSQAVYYLRHRKKNPMKIVTKHITGREYGYMLVAREAE